MARRPSTRSTPLSEGESSGAQNDAVIESLRQSSDSLSRQMVETHFSFLLPETRPNRRPSCSRKTEENRRPASPSDGDSGLVRGRISIPKAALSCSCSDLHFNGASPSSAERRGGKADQASLEIEASGILALAIVVLLNFGMFPGLFLVRLNSVQLQCDVCGAEQASILCCADEAVLCTGCDARIHSTNKLIGKHSRFSLQL
ncbi:putative salt tolerance-like protein [Platanthera zijinensis]|uniref:Salt tolerance-like protein n=1 Tax=Platanthera zijinensis TaxID=2320716 RepID=A0AAP0B342_9ASPA